MIHDDDQCCWISLQLGFGIFYLLDEGDIQTVASSDDRFWSELDIA